jgi:hypothetical protein
MYLRARAASHGVRHAIADALEGTREVRNIWYDNISLTSISHNGEVRRVSRD